MKSRRKNRWAAEKLQENLKSGEREQQISWTMKLILRAEYENFQNKGYKHI